jgi:hypothetical protein
VEEEEKIDDLVKSQKTPFSVIPAEAGIQEHQELLDPGFRRGDDLEDFLRDRQTCSMEFCDLNCRYARWPEERAVDGAESCRTFQAVFCEKRNRLVHKNAPCSEKKKKPRGVARSPEP